ncbi:GNAT family acetyltransferase [Microbaculum marinisediminis]|uniref:GNAT family acetyltransferase n=1 Tax=Microbaculum marinisediminis TaxID=2931392 RepID=A0AAW5QQC0_9HYPH|nr:GNAT family acetyltransferase [Microbaculum sp. A6E488]
MPKLTVTEITNADVEAVADLWARCGLTRPWNDPHTDIAFARAAPSATILVGRADGAIAASAMVGHDGHRGTVYYVCVDPRRQGSGLGREIMAAAEDWLRGQGVWKLNLMVRTDNTKVIDFYTSVGYDVEERVNMAKWLDPAKKPA